VNELRVALTQATPPITLVNTKHLPHWQLETAHTVVLLAMDDDQVLINDPGTNQGRLVIGLDEFLLAWDEMANLCGLIRKV
jgi:hypothetical protein